MVSVWIWPLKVYCGRLTKGKINDESIRSGLWRRNYGYITCKIDIINVVRGEMCTGDETMMHFCHILYTSSFNRCLVKIIERSDLLVWCVWRFATADERRDGSSNGKRKWVVCSRRCSLSRCLPFSFIFPGNLWWMREKQVKSIAMGQVTFCSLFVDSSIRPAFLAQLAAPVIVKVANWIFTTF